MLKKPISSELGNVSPVVIVPADYDDDQLAFVAANVATQITNNASFNCNAAKMLVTSRAWPQRDAFLGNDGFLSAVPFGIVTEEGQAVPVQARGRDEVDLASARFQSCEIQVRAVGKVEIA